jgi:hypothetical protein
MFGLHCVDCGECLVYIVWIVVNVRFTLWIVVNVRFTLCGLC